MSKSIKLKTNLHELLNNETFNDFYSYFRLLALSVFEWKNLPDSVNARYLETMLFTEGKALFFNDDKMGFMALGCTISGNLNVYREATGYQAVGVTYTKHYDADQCVLIRNNFDMVPTSVMATLFAERASKAERTIDININAQKTPKILACDESQRLTFENIIRQYDGNTPLILTDKMINQEMLRSIDMTAPYVADKIVVYKHNLINDYVTRLGLNSANTDKKERLIVDEVEANNELIELSKNTMLAPRQEAARKINQMFGLNVSVDIRKPERELIEGDESIDESIHDEVEDDE